MLFLKLGSRLDKERISFKSGVMEDLTVSEIAVKIKKKELSPEEIAQEYLKKIEKEDPSLNAFINLNKEILKETQSLNDNGPLYGVPLGVKDMFCTRKLRTTAGSRMLENFVPPYSATVVERLQKAGALVLGKCNNDEFAMGSTCETSYFGTSKNPWNKDHSPGGSSGGSASAVAARLCPASLGTDTGGSIRLPAHFCNLVGVKPTYGRVSRYGIIAYGSSLDQAGPLTKTVEDSALILDAISGWDSRDSTTASLKPSEFHKNLNPKIDSLKVAWFPLEKLQSSGTSLEIHPDIHEAQEKVLKVFKSLGCSLVEKTWPFFHHGVSVYYLISTSEASSNLARYDGVRYGFKKSHQAKTLKEFYETNRGDGFGEEVQRRILMGAFCLSQGYYEAYFQKACEVRRLIKESFEEIFKSCDVILAPVAFSPAFKLGEKIKPLEKYLNDQFTVTANLTGFPALSVPAHFSKDNLPIGVQLLGPAFGEQKILNAALALEKEFQLYKKRPHEY